MLSSKEIKLGQTKYFILQYLRGTELSLFSAPELAKTLELHPKTVAKHLRELRDMGIIRDDKKFADHLREIEVTDEWQ